MLLTPKFFLNELWRLGKTECRLFLSTPNKIAVSPFVKYPIFRHHTKEFTETQLVELFGKAGWKIINFNHELAKDSPALKIRKALCWLGGFFPFKFTSRLLENIFYALKSLAWRSNRITIKPEVIDNFEHYNTPLPKSGVVHGFFVQLKK